MKLAPFYERIGPFLEGRVGLDETKRALFGERGSRDAHRLSIYARFCREHRNTATGGVHTETRALITRQRGEPFWRQLVEDYFAQHPMQHPEINENGAQLAAFLAARGEPLWGQLADFEWWEWRTYVARDDAADREPDTGALRLGATVELRPYAWNFVDWLDDEARAPEPEREDVVVLFWRDRELSARRALTTPAELVVLKQVSEGLAVAASEVFDDLLAAGIVLGRR
ncbi:MAG: putative DNA-binding domain-containing protein [Myxococcota bacterium]